MEASKPITVIEGNVNCAWEPKNTKERMTRDRDEEGEKVAQAELRRDVLRQELMERVGAHHDKVRKIARKKRGVRTPDGVTKKQENAKARRELMQLEKRQRVAEHHKKIDTALEKTKMSPKRMSEKHSLAEQRRNERLKEQLSTLQEKSQRISTVRLTKKMKEESLAKSAQSVITCYKLDSTIIEESSFDQVQRVLTSRQTVQRATDLIQLLSTNFERLIAEERPVITDDTPVGSSPSKSTGKIPLNPRAFLSAYICMGGLSEGTDKGPLETAVQEHAVQLINTLRALLAALEDDASLDTKETRERMKEFAKEWAAYETSFEAWKKKDHKELLEHYITTYSEMERGRVDIIAQTAATGSRRPQEHAELMTAIEESLMKLRTQIERLGGSKGTDELGSRLQQLYDTHQLTPPLLPTATPVTSDIEMENTPKTSAVPPPPLSPYSGCTSSPSSAGEEREKLQTLLLKAKMAHDVVFNTKKPADEEEEDSSTLTVKKIKKAAEKAFWDILAEELSATPPMTERLGGALQGLKDLLFEVTPRKMKEALELELKDCVDWELLKHSLNYDTLQGLVRYFMDKVLELEAPAENEATKAATDEMLAKIDAGGPATVVVVEALRFLHEKLDTLVKAIHEAKKTLIGPLLAKDAENLVKELYKEEVQQGIHTFGATKKWLEQTIKAAVPVSGDSKPEEYGFPLPLTTQDIFEKTNKLYTMVPKLALLKAVLKPKSVGTQAQFPEVLRLHRDLVRIYADQAQIVTLTAAISGLAGQLSGCSKVMKPVADEVSEMLKTPGLRLPAIIDQVVHIIDREKGEPMTEQSRMLLVGVLEKVANVEDKVYATYHNRLFAIIGQLVLCGPQDMPSIASTPFAHLAAPLQELTFSVSKLCALNLNWTRAFYDPILSAISQEMSIEKEKALESGEL
eukprot:TRINITY_DN102_c0_g2_i2.p1 TRINITY_DN102_c0_g2~~TRINITY_DN102_c0_g2_i2.p1  ORF type:complete len:916 (+),score=279.67 TRINITY_DN102_c0_g2_i2:79-2826(+)